MLCSSYITAQEVKDSVQIYFHVGKAYLDTSWRGNGEALGKIVSNLKNNRSDSIFRLQKILVVGAASPEGSIALNKSLSEKRAATLFEYMSQYQTLPDSLKQTNFIGRDWESLLALAEKDPKLPYREETLGMLRSIVRETREGTVIFPDPLVSIQRLHGGVPYRYMYLHFFPQLRYSHLHLWFRKVQNPIVPIARPQHAVALARPDLSVATLSVSQPTPPSEKPFYMAVKTNLLYDALLVPNVGVEFNLGKNWSLAANWMYAWWNNDRKHNYWRIYGGDIGLRKWFGRAAERKPLTGHHIGIYAQTLTYDFERGGRGYMGGEPGGNLFDHASYAAGIEYGYSLPIARRLNLDFTLGIGYLGGKYYEYEPQDGHNVWQATKNRHWFGPTKAEVSLVWLLGRNNVNPKKEGGRR